MSKNFALVGAAGFVAPRHMKAIHETGNRLVAAADRSDNVGVLDQYFPECRFFTEFERFDRHLEKLRRRPESERIHYVSVCSPNYLHDAHIRLGLRLHATVLCEKPLVINPWNLDQLEALEEEYGAKVNSVLQLRLHPDLIALKERLDAEGDTRKRDVLLTYVTRRGLWYDVSWKGAEDKSGGVAMNIGVHFFDLLMWLFGAPQRSEVHVHEPRRMSGAIELDRARVRWLLSVEASDLPPGLLEKGKTAFRSITMDGQEIEFSGGFTDLHTRSYQSMLDGRGFGIAESRPSIELVHQIRHSRVVAHRGEGHPAINRGAGALR